MNEEYFSSGFYEEYWGGEFQEADARDTAGHILDRLDAKKGKILDWCGGWGRISIYFARKGFEVTLLDFLPKYLEQAEQAFAKENLPLETICTDCRRTPQDIGADYATCVFNTTGFFNDEEQLKAFKSLYGALKPGGKIILDCMNLFFISHGFLAEMKRQGEDGRVFNQKNRFDFFSNTLESDFEIIDADGRLIKQKPFSQRMYTPKEMLDLLKSAGFEIDGLFGGYAGEPFTFNIPQIIITASKDKI
jgi:D-alanine-D-alanine ligase